MSRSVQTVGSDDGTQVDLVPHLPPAENKRFYPALDGFRAFAVILVFFQHYINEPVRLHWGWIGVDFFFVLSGFLITGILYDTRNARHRFRNFYVRRTLRIFPLYYAVLLAAFATTPIFHWAWSRGWAFWAVYLGNYLPFLYPAIGLKDPYFFGNLHSSAPFAGTATLYFSHFWSLCVEEQFYLVWPCVVYLVKDRVRLRNLCAAIVLVTPLVRLLGVLVLPQAVLHADFLYVFTPLRIDSLLLGGLVALCLRGPEAAALARLALPVLWSVLAVFAMITTGFLVVTHQLPEPHTDVPWICTIGFLLLDLLAASVILLAIEPGTFFYRVFTLRWLRWLGQMSYGFYIFHSLLHAAFLRLTVAIVGPSAHINLPTAVVGFFGTIAISYLSFRFFESPFLRLKDRFTV